MSDPKYYRDMAKQMRGAAARASSQDVARGYRELARQWEVLASHAASFLDRSDPWPDLDEDSRR
jgi:hypothetical protein